MPVEWRQIPGYEGLYEVSSDGRIRSMVSGLERKLQLEHGTRPMVQLWANNTYKVHKVCRLVLLAFEGPPPIPSWTASHLNGISTDNRPENLIWESFKDNLARKYEHDTVVHGEASNLAKLSEAQVNEIREAVGTQSAIAERYGIHQSQVSRIKLGKRWARSHQEQISCVQH